MVRFPNGVSGNDWKLVWKSADSPYMLPFPAFSFIFNPVPLFLLLKCSENRVFSSFSIMNHRVSSLNIQNLMLSGMFSTRMP